MNRGIYKAGLAMFGATGLHRLVESRTGGLGAILMLHHVRPARDGAFQPNRHLEITPDFLDALLEHLAARGFDFVSLDDLVDRLERPDRTRRRFVALTLDDGYRDNVEFAWPIFARHQVPFTVFVCSGLVDRWCGMWWRVIEAAIARVDALTADLGRGPTTFKVETPEAKQALFEDMAAFVHRLSEEDAARFVAGVAESTGVDALALTDDALATWDDLRAMAADDLCTIGAHTVTHPMLARLDAATARMEMARGADRIAEMMGRRPAHFAYPYGYASVAAEREFALARELGFRAAVTTRPGVIEPRHSGDPTALPRVSVNGFFQSIRETDVLLSGAPFALLRLLGKAA